MEGVWGFGGVELEVLEGEDGLLWFFFKYL